MKSATSRSNNLQRISETATTGWSLDNSSSGWSLQQYFTLAATAAAALAEAKDASASTRFDGVVPPSNGWLGGGLFAEAGAVSRFASSGSAAGSNASLAFTPTDTQYANQWHLQDMGNIEAIWNEYDGSGVNVGVYDEGIQNHFDLDAHYNAALHINIGGTIYDGRAYTGPHGTSVAGLIGAEANGLDTVGVAFNANLTGVNIFDPSGANAALYINSGTPTGFYEAIRQSANFDVVNNSWGADPNFLAFQDALIDGSFSEDTLDGWEFATVNGRGGLGTVVVKSAGNEYSNSNGDNLNSSRITVTIAALGVTGEPSSYSNYGADVLVSAGGGDFDGTFVTATDLLGTEGYNLSTDPTGSYDFTDQFGGTSSAAPIVSGVVALILDANPNLGWRDVHNILAASSTYAGDPTTTSATEYADLAWFNNAASTWNGGGYHFSEHYGYGQVNAYNAVRLAETWLYAGATAQTSANEASASTSATFNQAIPDLTNSTYTFGFTSGIEAEFIEVTVSLTHTYFTDLDIYLISPDGTEVMLTDGSAGSSSTSDGTFTWAFGAEAFRGEDLTGTWTLRINDTVGGDAGTLYSVAMTAYGATATNNDTYVFTDEFSTMVASNSARQTVADANGGVDTLNAAAVAAASTIRLNGGTSVIDGVNVTLSGIENAIGGDGGDTFYGNTSANKLYGMRGNDRYVVDSFSDQVFEVVGQGTDDRVYSSVSYTLAANQSIEWLATTNQSGTGTITLTGNNLAQLISGNNGANTLSGGGGGDRMYGHAGDDRYIIGSYSDKVFEVSGAGHDRVYTSRSYTLQDNQSIEWLATTNQSGTGTMTLIGNNVGQLISGNNGANVIDGKGGSDSLYGQGGADTFRFSTALSSGNVDAIRDYSAAADQIQLSQAIFTGIGGTLDAGEFRVGTAAGDANDRIIYNSSTGALFFDADGSGAGAQVQFATLTTKPALTAGEFQMIA